MSPEHVWVVVPAYNEESTIAAVLGALRNVGLADILVVDDGSRDRTAATAEANGARVVRHRINRGLGGALGTGLAAALQLGAHAVVTVDADGQHDPKDVGSVLAPVLSGRADVAIGSRQLGRHAMPWVRRVANWVANVVTCAIFGRWSSDSQSGLRAFSRAALERIRIRTTGFEVSSEIIGEVSRLDLRYVEVPIRPIYTPYSLSKGQSFRNGLRTLGHLILGRYRS